MTTATADQTTESKSHATERFEKGSLVPFIGLSFKYPNGNTAAIGTGGMYRPWEGPYLSMKVEILRCSEHHKVPNEHDEKNNLKYDGFIFENTSDPTDQWFNQYPTASYGQFSTIGDATVFRNLASYEGVDQAAWSMVSVKSFLQDLERGIKQTLDKGMSEDHASLVAHRDEVLAKLKEKGVTVEISPFMIGDRQLGDSFKVAVFVDGCAVKQTV